jgi:hypothetical protein
MPWAEPLSRSGALHATPFEVPTTATAPATDESPTLLSADDARGFGWPMPRSEEGLRNRRALDAVLLPVQGAGVAPTGDDLRCGASAVGAVRCGSRILTPRPSPCLLAAATDGLHVEPVVGRVSQVMVVLPGRPSAVGAGQRVGSGETPAPDGRVDAGSGSDFRGPLRKHEEQYTMAVVACALQEVIRRLELLEGVAP